MLRQYHQKADYHHSQKCHNITMVCPVMFTVLHPNHPPPLQDARTPWWGGEDFMEYVFHLSYTHHRVKTDLKLPTYSSHVSFPGFLPMLSPVSPSSFLPLSNPVGFSALLNFAIKLMPEVVSATCYSYKCTILNPWLSWRRLNVDFTPWSKWFRQVLISDFPSILRYFCIHIIQATPPPQLNSTLLPR